MTQSSIKRSQRINVQQKRRPPRPQITSQRVNKISRVNQEQLNQHQNNIQTQLEPLDQGRRGGKDIRNSIYKSLKVQIKDKSNQQQLNRVLLRLMPPQRYSDKQRLGNVLTGATVQAKIFKYLLQSLPYTRVKKIMEHYLARIKDYKIMNELILNSEFKRKNKQKLEQYIRSVQVLIKQQQPDASRLKELMFESLCQLYPQMHTRRHRAGQTRSKLVALIRNENQLQQLLRDSPIELVQQSIVNRNEMQYQFIQQFLNFSNSSTRQDSEYAMEGDQMQQQYQQHEQQQREEEHIQQEQKIEEMHIQQQYNQNIVKQRRVETDVDKNQLIEIGEYQNGQNQQQSQFFLQQDIITQDNAIKNTQGQIQLKLVITPFNSQTDIWDNILNDYQQINHRYSY